MFTQYVICYWNEKINHGSGYRGRFVCNSKTSHGLLFSWSEKDASTMVIYIGNFTTAYLFLLSQRTM